MAEQTKTCPNCGKVLPVSEFYTNKSRKDGLSTYCKECTKIINYSYRDKEYKKPSAFSLSDVSVDDLVKEIMSRGKKVMVDPLPRDLISELCSLGYRGSLEYVEVHKIDVASFNKRNNI